MNLEFIHPSQHSLHQFTGFNKTLLEKRDWKTIDAISFGRQLVVHAHPVAALFLKRILEKISSQLIIDKINYLTNINNYIQGYSPWKNIESQSLIEQLYDLHNPIYYGGGGGHKNQLLIVFDTIYNAFGVSNLVLYSMLKSKGYHFLLLKDPSLACYMRGVPTWGSNLQELGKKLTIFAKDHGYQSLRVMGYSSAGYASCYISSLIACERYLGFSIASDLSVNSNLPLAWFMAPNIREYLHTNEFINLRDPIANTHGVERRLVAGALWQDDVLHVENLQGLENLQIDIMEQAFHDTPLAAIHHGQLDNYLSWLME